VAATDLSALAHELRHGGTYVIEQGAECIAIAILHALHQGRPRLAALRRRSAIRLFIRPAPLKVTSPRSSLAPKIPSTGQ